MALRLAEADSTSILLSALDANTTYYYRVKALATVPVNDSNWSAIKSATTNQKIQLSAPTNLTVENVFSSSFYSHATLLWNIDVVEGCSNVVEFKKANESSWTNLGEYISGPNSEGKYWCMGDSLNPETTYDFRVRHVAPMISDYADSEYSNVVTVTTPPTPTKNPSRIHSFAISGE